ncbi:glycosyltransferase [Limimaricola hongkongensis]|uniref:Putative glycosyl transferase n=1 Tax=Limimaricola hongkongensis DSM 17492 TaxID=1122180 RepID=A0A017H8W9_9RHOB|nr:glycosyltransferase [Limimaricola hongkongensis]EYD70558.1 putative glycosyl transferase [Limimaricola hongkongensis DSM 17492]
MTRIAAVVVTYNRLPALQETLNRLLSEPLDHVIVVENGSTDGTGDWLATQSDPRLVVLRPESNLGGAGGFEMGLRDAAARFDPDWTVLMDDDARPAPGAIAAFRGETLPTLPDDTGAVAAAVFLPDGAVCEMNRPTRNPFWDRKLFWATLRGGTHAFHLTDAELRGAAAQPVDVASFVGFFLSRAALERVGLPDGGMFIYGDDVSYSLRLRRAGMGLLLDPRLRFEHACGSLGTDMALRPIWKIYYLARNNIEVCRLATGPVLWPFAVGFYALAWMRRSRRYPAAERGLYRRMLRAGLRDGLRGRSGRNDAIHAASLEQATASG